MAHVAGCRDQGIHTARTAARPASSPAARPGRLSAGQYPMLKRRDAKRLVVLASGTGTNLQALLDACAADAYGARVVAVGADRDSADALARAGAARVTTFTLRVQDFPAREDWDRALTAACAGFEPDLVAMAGLLKLAGAPSPARAAGARATTRPPSPPSAARTASPADPPA